MGEERYGDRSSLPTNNPNMEDMKMEENANTNANAQNVNPENNANAEQQQPQNEKHFTWKTAVKWTAVVGCVAIIGICLGKLYKASKATADAATDVAEA